ncbi:C40 family peptidase [uncultured Kocuria sp.]|uniref:C40 family peptidase n=1 Tax=uncultured Kocuria sp. TaxID=259305 RepID=UPI002632721C|nr:C40 family peptidase [uncultured Kocuria sp.]
MSLFKQNTARHRAESTSRAVRNTTIAAAAGAAMIGSIAPAQAYAQAPVESGAAYSAPAPASASLAGYTSYTYQAPVAAQPAAQPAAPAYEAPAPAAQQTAATSSVTPQSTAITEISPAAGGIVGTAMSAQGAGYVYGGTSYGAWDCSGFTGWVYAQNGIDLPRTSFQQIAAATPTTNPQPGDLVSQNGGNHIGIYIGGGKMISALNPTQGTFVHSVNAMQLDGYYTF